jgi:hypothetical protein
VVVTLTAHAKLLPRDRFMIRSFIGEEFPTQDARFDISIEAILPKQTFWQMVAILHAEHHRPRELSLRLSRHYYDIAILADSAIGTAALADMALLNQVVAHQEWAHPRSWGRYHLAQPGTLRPCAHD